MARAEVDTRAPEMTSEAPGVYRGADTQVADAAEHFGDVVNEFAKRYGAWQNHIAITQAGTHLESNLQQAKTALEQSPQPLQTWNEIDSGYGEAVDNAVQGHNPIVATHIKEMYDRAHIGLQAYAQATIYRHTKKVAADTLTQASQQGAASVYADPASLENVLGALKGSYMGQVGTLYADKAGAEKDYSEAAANIVQAGIEKHLANHDFVGAQAYLDKYGNDLSPEQETGLKYKIDSIHHRQNDLNLENAKGIFNDQIARAMSTGTVDSAQVSKINQLLSDPELKRQRADFNSTLKMAKQMYADSQKWEDMSADEIRSDVSGIKPDDPNNAAAYRLIQKHSVAAEKFIKARNDDPALFMRQAGYTTYTGIEQREQKLGLPIKPFTNNQATEIGSEIHNAQDTRQKVALVSTVLDGDPQQGIEGAGTVGLQQVIEAAKLPASLALTRDMKLSAAESYFQVNALPKAKMKEMIASVNNMGSESASVADWQRKVQTALSPYMAAMQGVNPSNFVHMSDAVSAIALGYAEQGKSNPIQHAVEDLYDGIKVSNKTMMPANANPDDVDFNLTQKLKDVKPDSVYAPNGMSPYSFWAIQRPQAHWVLDNTHGAAQYILFGAGGPIYKKDGSLITVSLKDATTPLNREQAIKEFHNKGAEEQLRESGLYGFAGIH